MLSARFRHSLPLFTSSWKDFCIPMPTISLPPSSSGALPAPRATSPAMRKEQREKIALFRYQIIREAATPDLSTKQRGALVRTLAAVEHPWPYGGIRSYSRETLDRWIKAWRSGGFEALRPDERTSMALTEPSILLLAETLKREKPNRTAAQVKRIITETVGQSPSETTLLRLFRAKNIPTGVTPTATGRFEADHSNQIWVGDALHGPRIGGRKTYLFAFLDDHSRMVTAARWAYAEDAVRLGAVLRPAVQTHGIPEVCYLDNGAAMSDKSLARTCAKLGIRLTHSAPYRPQGRGKIERFFNTVTSQFLTEIVTTTKVSASKGDLGPAVSGSAVDTVAELITLFIAWVNMVYHHQQHSTTGQTPIDRWERSWAHREPVRKSLEEIRQAFLWSDLRRVSKSGTVSLHSNTYEVEPVLAGTKVELVYDPFDLESGITVNSHLGVACGVAKALEISRHVHAKAVNAHKDADDSVLVSTGIDYLGLVAGRHKDSLTAAPIRFADLQHTGTEQPTHAAGS